jgi:hypothetical protein
VSSFASGSVAASALLALDVELLVVEDPSAVKLVLMRLAP